MFDKIIRAVIQDNPNINRDRAIIAIYKTAPLKRINKCTLSECNAWVKRAIQLLKREFITYECVEEADTAKSLYTFTTTHKIDDIRVELYHECEVTLCFRDNALNDTCYVRGIKSIDIWGIHFLDGTTYFEENNEVWVEFINNLINKALQGVENELYD